MLALGRGIYVGSLIQRQHRHIVHTIGRRVVAKVNVPGQVVLDRLLEQAGTIADDAAGQSETRADERPSPISHECASVHHYRKSTRRTVILPASAPNAIHAHHGSNLAEAVPTRSAGGHRPRPLRLA